MGLHGQKRDFKKPWFKINKKKQNEQEIPEHDFF